MFVTFEKLDFFGLGPFSASSYYIKESYTIE